MNSQNQRGGQSGGARRGTPSNQPVQAASDIPQKLPFPQASRLQSCIANCRNAGLVFDRYIRFRDEWKLDEYSISLKKKESAKLFNLKEVAAVQKRCSDDDKWKQLHQQFITRWRETVKSQNAIAFPLTPEWRFVTGLGDKAALEVGFTFHRIYGFPIIPGSSLKGLARAAALLDIAEKMGVKILPLHAAKEHLQCEPRPIPTPLQRLDALLLANDERLDEQDRVKKKLQEEENNALQALMKDVPQFDIASHRSAIRLFRTIFGTQYAAGQAVFFDAVPSEPPVLEVDVMNPHFSKYYQDDQNHEFPTDSDHPIPVFFLTVGRSPFLFAVGWRGEGSVELQEQAKKWLKYSLMNMGAGAKTAAGYGFFGGTENE